MKQRIIYLLILLFQIGLCTSCNEGSSTNSYTVTWKNYDGVILETDANVAYGTMPTYDGATPTRDSTKDYIYDFCGWDKPIEPVKSDIIYTAIFNSRENVVNLTKDNYKDYLQLYAGVVNTETFIDDYGNTAIYKWQVMYMCKGLSTYKYNDVSITIKYAPYLFVWGEYKCVESTCTINLNIYGNGASIIPTVYAALDSKGNKLPYFYPGDDEILASIRQSTTIVQLYGTVKPL